MVDNKTETIDCSWDGGPTRRAAWFKKLPKAMALKGHRTLWERGVTTDRGRITITATPEHSWQLANLNVQDSTFANACPLFSYRLRDITKVKPTALLSDGSLTPDTRAPLTEEQKKRYQDNPDILREASKKLFDDIVATITNEMKVEDYERATAGDGLALIVLLVKEQADGAEDMVAYAASERAKLVLAGIHGSTRVDFDNFRKDYEMWTGMMGTCAEPAVVTAGVYATQVRNLGVLISTKFDLKLDSTAGARNDLPKMIPNAHSCSTPLESASSCVAWMSYAPTVLLAPQTSSDSIFACPALTALQSPLPSLKTPIDASAIDPRALHAWRAPHTAATAPQVMSTMNTGTLSNLRTSLKSFTARTRPPMLRRSPFQTYSIQASLVVWRSAGSQTLELDPLAWFPPHHALPHRAILNMSPSACRTRLFATWLTHSRLPRLWLNSARFKPTLASMSPWQLEAWAAPSWGCRQIARDVTSFTICAPQLGSPLCRCHLVWQSLAPTLLLILSSAWQTCRPFASYLAAIAPVTSRPMARHTHAAGGRTPQH